MYRRTDPLHRDFPKYVLCTYGTVSGDLRTQPELWSRRSDTGGIRTQALILPLISRVGAGFKPAVTRLLISVITNYGITTSLAQWLQNTGLKHWAWVRIPPELTVYSTAPASWVTCTIRSTYSGKSLAGGFVCTPNRECTYLRTGCHTFVEKRNNQVWYHDVVGTVVTEQWPKTLGMGSNPT
jgi:hypothetical protein